MSRGMYQYPTAPPGEGTWSVFAEQVVEQRDKVLAEKAELELAFRSVVAILDRDGGQTQAGESVQATRERAVEIAAQLVHGLAAKHPDMSALMADNARLRATLRDVLAHMPGRAVKMRARIEAVLPKRR